MRVVFVMGLRVGPVQYNVKGRFPFVDYPNSRPVEEPDDTIANIDNCHGRDALDAISLGYCCYGSGNGPFRADNAK